MAQVKMPKCATCPEHIPLVAKVSTIDGKLNVVLGLLIVLAGKLFVG